MTALKEKYNTSIKKDLIATLGKKNPMENVHRFVAMAPWSSVIYPDV